MMVFAPSLLLVVFWCSGLRLVPASAFPLLMIPSVLLSVSVASGCWLLRFVSPSLFGLAPSVCVGCRSLLFMPLSWALSLS